MFLLSFFVLFFFWGDHCNPQNAATHVPRFFSLLPWQLNNAMFLTEKGHRQGNIVLTHRQLNFSTSTKVQKGRSVPGPKLPPGSPNAIQRVQMKDVSWKIASLSAVQRRRSAHTYTHTHTAAAALRTSLAPAPATLGQKSCCVLTFSLPPSPHAIPLCNYMLRSHPNMQE